MVKLKQPLALGLFTKYFFPNNLLVICLVYFQMDAESQTEHNLFGGKYITELTDEDIAKGDSWSAMR